MVPVFFTSMWKPSGCVLQLAWLILIAPLLTMVEFLMVWRLARETETVVGAWAKEWAKVE